MSTFIQKSTSAPIGTISFNRPEALNAFNLKLAEEFIATLDEMTADHSIRVIVLRGEGRVFSAGGDVKEMLRNVESGDRAAYFRDPLSAFGRMIMAIRRTPKPVLAALHGAVAGVAFNLVLSTDIRVAAESSRFTQAFIRLGVSPDGGGTWWLPRLVGLARANELAMLPTVLDSQTALDWGLVNRVVPDDQFEKEVHELAQELAEAPVHAVAQVKSLINQAYHNTLEDQMEIERLAQVENAETSDFEEGLRAFVEKREPKFGNSI